MNLPITKKSLFSGRCTHVTPSLVLEVTLNCTGPSAAQLPIPNGTQESPKIQGFPSNTSLSLFNNPLEIMALQEFFTAMQERPSICMASIGRQVTGLALWHGSIVSTCRLDCQEVLDQDQGLSSQGSPVGTILPSLILLPCAQVSSCHPEAWLRLGSP